MATATVTNSAVSGFRMLPAFAVIIIAPNRRRPNVPHVTRRQFLGTAGIAAAAPALGATAAQAQGDERPIIAEKNVVFGKGGDMELRCDIYRPPAGTEKRMATVHIHGGGFTGGSKEMGERILPF